MQSACPFENVFKLLLNMASPGLLESFDVHFMSQCRQSQLTKLKLKMCQNFPALHCIFLYRGLLKSKVSYVKEKAKKNLHILHTSNKNKPLSMNVLLKERKKAFVKRQQK